MHLLSLLFACLLALPLWAKPVSDPHLLQLVDYVGVDYEEAIGDKQQIKNAAEYAEMQEFSEIILETIQALPHNPQKKALINQAKKLKTLIEQKAPLAEVREQTSAITAGLQKTLKVTLTPSQTPDLSLGKKRYQENCVACHGATGAGDGPLASNMEPAPTNFLDPNRMSQLSQFALYNTITLGVQGTPMASYEKTFTEAERWSLAYYIKSLTASDPFVITLHNLALSLQSYEKNDHAVAYQYALAAYLDGFETAEAVIDVLDRDKRLAIEAQMMDFREAIQQDVSVAELKTHYDALHAELSKIQSELPTTTFSNPAIFFSSLVILLREGLESILIVGMLIVMLIKAEKRSLLPAIHAGWVSAILAGALTWWASHSLISISGATREVTEGITALVAAGILLYVGIWIHRNQLAHDWRTYLKEKFSKHVTEEARWGLGALSFLAVYREMFETILFYEALGLQVGAQGANMIWLGIVVALALLGVIVFAMVRYGLKLPIQAFFRVSAWLIFLFAIVFIGQGIHGLEEAGKVPVWTVPFPRIDMLGIYPNLFGLMLQGAVLACAIYLGFRKNA